MSDTLSTFSPYQQLQAVGIAAPTAWSGGTGPGGMPTVDNPNGPTSPNVAVPGSTADGLAQFVANGGLYGGYQNGQPPPPQQPPQPQPQQPAAASPTAAAPTTGAPPASASAP